MGVLEELRRAQSTSPSVLTKLRSYSSVLTICRDTTEQRAAEAALKNLNATLEARVEARTLELKRANHDLKTFADTASHDLRAPLRAIAGSERGCPYSRVR